MLSLLHIENIAVIESADISFDRGFNVLTGETGAGKSILIDSIHAVLGGRISRDLIRTGAKSACVTAVFERIPRSLAAELAPTGIRVNCVAPGVIDTDMVQVLGQETLDSLARDQIPLGRLGKAEEIAETVLYLARAGYTTGQVITVDGGFII